MVEADRAHRFKVWVGEGDNFMCLLMGSVGVTLSSGAFMLIGFSLSIEWHNPVAFQIFFDLCLALAVCSYIVVLSVLLLAHIIK